MTGVIFLVVAAALSFTPIVPRVSAVDPTPTPTTDPTPTPSVDPGPTPTADPGPTPTPEPTPTPDPTASPTDSPSPSPSDSPSPSPTDSPSPSPSDSPSPSPSGSPSPSPTATLPPGTIGPAGGSAHLSNVYVSVPKGALGAPTRFSVTAATGPALGDQEPLEVFTLAAKDAATGDGVDAFASPLTMFVSLNGLDLTGVEQDRLRIGRLGQDDTWTLLDTTAAVGQVSVMVSSPGTFGVIEQPLTTKVTLTQESDAPAEGRHRIDPGAPLTLHLTVTPAGKLYRGDLTSQVPAGFVVLDPAGGTWDPATRRITWILRNKPAKAPVVLSPRVSAPSVAPGDGSHIFTATFSAVLEQAGADPTVAVDLTVLVAPRISIEHSILGTPAEDGRPATYVAQDTVMKDVTVFRPFRVRFRLENVDSVPASIAPHLEYRPLDVADAAFRLVPDPATFGEAAFHTASEQADAAPTMDPITAAGAMITSSGGRHPGFVSGYRSGAINPGAALDLPGDSATEIEFTVSPTVFAEYLAGYEFRLTDGGAEIGFAVTAQVQIEREPAPDLSPGQRGGQPVESVRYQLQDPDLPGTARAAAAGPTTLLGPTPVAPIHGDMTLTSDSCAICHRVHTGQGASLVSLAAPQSDICFTCHDGTGAATGPSHQYALATPNDPSTASYYQHPATDPNAQHTNASDDEFGTVLNRHSVCTDCHNPHYPKSSQPSTKTSSGWTASGAEAGASGVSVANGGASSPPVYTFLVSNLAQNSTPVTLEYQLCFKCHSGYTVPPAKDDAHPSRWALDKGVEFNPSNVSYHPIEAPGKNSSVQLANSLSPQGTSPYKLWSFTPSTDTVRCTQCHADSRLLPALLAETPGAGDRLDDHASTNRGILLGNYRDRTTHVAGDGVDDSYDKLDFQLCYLCHAEAPFTTTSKDPRADTLFPLHGVHVYDPVMKTWGSATNSDIDSAQSAGGGNAICAECHFRIHSTVTRVGGQNAFTGLVNFAPDVTDLVADSWTKTTAPDGTVTGSCTLTCHGHTHNPTNSAYTAAP